MLGFIYTFYSVFSKIFKNFRIVCHIFYSVFQRFQNLFLLTLNKSVLIKFQNAQTFQHNGFINADKNHLDAFLSEK